MGRVRDFIDILKYILYNYSKDITEFFKLSGPAKYTYSSFSFVEHCFHIIQYNLLYEPSLTNSQFVQSGHASKKIQFILDLIELIQLKQAELKNNEVAIGNEKPKFLKKSPYKVVRHFHNKDELKLYQEPAFFQTEPIVFPEAISPIPKNYTPIAEKEMRKEFKSEENPKQNMNLLNEMMNLKETIYKLMERQEKSEVMIYEIYNNTLSEQKDKIILSNLEPADTQLKNQEVVEKTSNNEITSKLQPKEETVDSAKLEENEKFINTISEKLNKQSG